MLTYIVYQLPTDKKYTEFEIPKKGGGSRRISAPVQKLRALQRALAEMLDEFDAELRAREVKKRGALAHGFRRGHSIVTNAAPHRSQRFVLNLDLKDFFPSINFGRVRGFFLKNHDFLLHPTVATTIAQIACHGPGLPQGAPSSPTISNLIAHILDVRLARLAGSNGCVYSRYADDLTFSSHAKSFPADIAFQVGDENEWVLSNELQDAIKACGFSVNPKKTRMQCRANRQLVTGLTVNAKVNIRTEYYRDARAACDHLFSKGSCFKTNRISGQQEPLSIAALEGRLNHIQYVRGLNDARDEKAKLEHPTATRALYRRLTFYSAFAAADLPMIICEGKTDNVYLKYALKKLHTKFPKLAVTIGGLFVPKIRFFNYNRKEPFEFHSSAGQLSHLNGSSSHIKKFIEFYQDAIGFYDHAPRQAPVIALIDNDEGAKQIFGMLEGKYKVKVTAQSTAPFYHVVSNLYVVKTPEIMPKGESCIEDLFDPALLLTKVQGKTFNPTNDKLGPNEYGKVVFAEHVVKANAATIDFGGFDPLLARLDAVVSSYQPPPP